MIACTRDCYDTCVFDEGFRPVQGEPTFGFTCARGRADLARNERNRLLRPLIDGKDAELEDAVREVVKAMKGLKKEEVLHVDYDGNQGLLTWYFPARLWNAIGAASTDYSICSLEGHKALENVWDCSCGAGIEEFRKARAFALWGSNASVSFIHGWHFMKDKYKIAIDVWESETVRKSEKKFIINPSSDGWLALGVLKVLVHEGLGSLEHLDNAGALAELLDRVTLDEVSEVTGLSEDEIRELAELYYYYEPLTVIGFSIGRTYDGFNSVALISLIPAVLGLGRWFFYSNTYSLGIDFGYLRGLHMARPSRVVSMAEVGDEVEKGRVKFMFVWNSNPVLTLPMGDRIIEAVKEGRLFLVTHDPFVTETVKASNVAFPAPTYLEKEDVVYSYWHDYLVYNRPIRPKRGLTEVELMRFLSRALGLSHPLVEEDEWSALDYALRGTGVTVGELREKGVARVPRRIPEVRPDAGKVELPKRPPEGYYLVYSSHPLFTNTQFGEVYNPPASILSGEFEGEVELETRFGKVRVRARSSEHVRGKVFVAYKPVLKSVNLNSLTPPEKGRSGTPKLNATLVNPRAT